MTHYICTGECKTVSSQPGVCKDKECSRFQKPLIPCNCPDGEHYGAQEEVDEEGYQSEND